MRDLIRKLGGEGPMRADEALALSEEGWERYVDKAMRKVVAVSSGARHCSISVPDGCRDKVADELRRLGYRIITKYDWGGYLESRAICFAW